MATPSPQTLSTRTIAPSPAAPTEAAGPPLTRAEWLRLMLLAAIPRVLWGILVPVVPTSDAYAYDVFARNLAAGGCFGWEPDKPEAFWPVGTPWVYSVLYRGFDPERWGYGPVVALNIVFGLALVALAMLVARRWFGRQAQVWTGLLLAFWPMHVEFTTILHSETMFTGLVLAGMLLMPDSWRRWDRLVLVGLIFADASFVRPTALLLPSLFIAAAFLRDRNFVNALMKGVVIGTVMIVCISPWAMRNYRLFDQVVLISTNGGATLWMGNSPGSQGAYREMPPRPPGLNEAQFHRKLGQEAMAYIRAEPVAFVKRSLVKAVRLNERETIGVVWNHDGLARIMLETGITALKVLSQAYWMAMLVIGVVGVFIFTREQGLWAAMTHPGLALWAYITAIHAIILFQDRYHFPATPVIGAFAALAITRLQAWRLRTQLPASTPVPA